MKKLNCFGDTVKKLYHLSFDLEETTKKFVPRVPASAAQDEDEFTPRVCFAESVIGCLAAMASCEEHLWDGINSADFTTLMLFEVNFNELEPSLIKTPEQLYSEERVYDALLTGEHWYLGELTLEGREIRISRWEQNGYYFAYESDRERILVGLSDLLPQSIDNYKDISIMQLMNGYLFSELKHNGELEKCDTLDHRLLELNVTYSLCTYQAFINGVKQELAI